MSEVIDRCIYLDNKNPIVTIHDVGAGVFQMQYQKLLMIQKREER